MNIAKMIRAGALIVLGLGLAGAIAHAQLTGTGQYGQQQYGQDWQRQQQFDRGQQWGQQQQAWGQQPQFGQRQIGQRPVQRIHRASNLVGMDVRNFQQERVGRIEDLVVDPNTGQVAYVWLNADRILDGRETYVAVPLTAFQRTEDQRALFLDVDRQRLQRMHTFRRTELPDLNDPILRQTWQAWGGIGATGQFGYGRMDQQDRLTRDDQFRRDQMQFQQRTEFGQPGQRFDQQYDRTRQFDTFERRQEPYGRFGQVQQDRWDQQQRWTDQRYLDQDRVGVGGQAQAGTGFRYDTDRWGTQYQDRFETRYDRHDTFAPRGQFDARFDARGDRFGYQPYYDERGFAGRPGVDMQRGWAQERYQERMPEGSVRGQIVTINPETRTITVDTREHGIVAFDIDDRVLLNAMGNREARLTDFRVGHGVEIGYQDFGYGRPVAKTIIQTSALTTR